MASRALVEKDAKGLTALQRKFLQEVANVGSWQEACKTLDLDPRTARRYFKDEAFKTEYDELFNTEEIQTVKRELDMITSGVPKVYEDALSAETTKKVVESCPHCGEEVTFYVNVIDFKTRMKAGETLLKQSNLLKDTKRVEGEFKGTMTHINLTGAEILALQRLNMGLAIPPHVYEALKGKVADLPALPEGQTTILQNNEPIDGDYEVKE